MVERHFLYGHGAGGIINRIAVQEIPVTSSWDAAMIPKLKL